MKRLKQLIRDHKYSWDIRNEFHIKWRIECSHKDILVYSFFIIPTIEYTTYPYRQPGTFILNVYFLHWHIRIGEWCNKEESK